MPVISPSLQGLPWDQTAGAACSWELPWAGCHCTVSPGCSAVQPFPVNSSLCPGLVALGADCRASPLPPIPVSTVLCPRAGEWLCC